MSNIAPAIPLFGDAYLADTRHLSLEEHGAYLQLLMIAWRSEGCSLPDDDKRLARMLGITASRWGKLKPVVMGFWNLENGQWTQGRLSKERKFVEEKRAKNKSAAETRWERQEPENKQLNGCERISERNAPPPPQEVEEEVEAAPQLRASPQPVQQAFQDWNENARAVGWPTAISLSSARHRLLAARLRENGIDGWRGAIARARASPYLGRDPPSWFTFSWLLKSENFLKLIEGNYDRNRPDNRQAASGWGQARNLVRVSAQ